MSGDGKIIAHPPVSTQPKPSCRQKPAGNTQATKEELDKRDRRSGKDQW